MAEVEAAAPGRRQGLLLAAGLVWVAAWIGLTRHALLDDALIHLRYARMLLRAGFLTYDGTTFSYGTSSPLYVGLLAALSPLAPGVLLPKAVSVVFYLALLGLVAHSAREDGPARNGWVLLGLLLVSPMAVRWLTDGMETSLTALLAVVLARHASAPGTEERRPLVSAVLSLALGAALVLTRVELSLAIFFAVLGSLPVEPLGRLLRRHLPLALGGLASLAALRIAFGRVLPDTALAKSTAPVPFTEALFQVGRSTASALTLGAGLAALWLLTLALGLRAAEGRSRTALLACNLLFPTLVALIAARGQILHGVRYLLWVYLFLAAWNLRRGRPPLRRLPLRAAAAVLLALWIFEGRSVARVLGAREHMLLAMRSDGLERLRGATGAGFDIGFIAYFTQARILDFNGLVNGRDVAALAPGQRLRRLSAAKPDFLFVTQPQAEGLAPFLDLGAYRVCRRYSAATLSGEQVYFLALRRGLAWPAPCGGTLK